MLARLTARLQRRNAQYRQVLTGPIGEAVRDDLFRLGHIGRPTYVPGDPVGTAFNEGKRFMALHIAAILNMSDKEIVARAQTQARGDEHGEE